MSLRAQHRASVVAGFAWLVVTSFAPAQPVGFFPFPLRDGAYASGFSGLSADGRHAGGNAALSRDGRESFVFTAFSAPSEVRYIVQPFTTFDMGGWDIADDGIAMAGYRPQPNRADVTIPVIFSAQDGLRALSIPGPNQSAQFVGISGDGRSAVGHARRGSGFGEIRDAYRWTRTAVWQFIPPPRPDITQWSEAEASNRDGSIVVGSKVSVIGTTGVFRWTVETGSQELPPLPGSVGGTRRAFGVSSNGAYIVGDGDDATGRRGPILWGPGGILNLGIAGNYH